MKTSEVLNKAADLIEVDGWVQGPAGMRIDGPHCVQGAIQAAVGAPTYESGRGTSYQYFETAPCPAGEAVTRYIEATTSDDVWLWNDTHIKSAAEVIEVLRATAVIEAAREDARVEVSA